MLKKGLSVLLAFVLIISVFTILPVSFSAEEVDVIDEGTSQESTESISEQSSVEETISDEELIDNKTEDIAEVGAEEGLAEEGADVEVAETGATRTQDEAVQWIKDRGNEGWWDNVDGKYGCQCVDLIMAYYQYLGYSRMSGSAYEYQWNHIPSGSGWYYSGYPIPGSIFVKGQGGDYTYGHVGLVYAVDGSTMYTVETNLVSPYDGGYSYARAQFRTRSVSFANTFINPDFVIPVPPTPQGHVMSDSEGAGRTIPDGDYWICSRIAQDYFIDIPGDNFNTKDGDNLKTWIWNPSLSLDYLFPGKWDVFHFTYLNNGFYRITQYYTNMAIDVDGASLYRGTNVQMWGVNDSNAQQWSIEKTNKGYKLRAKCNSYYLDINGAEYHGDTNVQTWEGNDTDAQFFSFIPYSPDERPIADGIYSVGSSVGKNCYLDVSGLPGEFAHKSNVQIWNWEDPDETFRFEYAGKGFYRIYEATSNLAVEITNEGAYLDECKNAVLYGKTNSRGQFWKVRKNADGTYFVYNALSGYCLDVEGGKTDKGTNVRTYLYNGSNAQKWKPLRVLQDSMVTVNDVSITSDDTTVTPQVIVKVDNTTLKADTDYTVTTTTDIANGKGTVTVVGKNNYCKTITKEFNTSCALLDKAVTVNNMTITSDVTEIKPQVTVRANGKTLKVDTNYALTIDADIAGGTGTVTVTGKNGYTGTITKSFTITVNDTTIVNDFFGNKYETEKDDIITYYANLTSPIQVNHLNGIIYFNQEVLEPIIANEISYNVPVFDNGHFQPMGAGQLRFDVYSSKPLSLNNVMVIRMQFRVIKKGGETWLGHQFETPEFTYENRDNYNIEAYILTNQELYGSSAETLGDADGDGEVSSIDVTLVQRYNAWMDNGIDEDVLMNADVDDNGELEIVDATYIQRYLAYMETPYAIGEKK